MTPREKIENAIEKRRGPIPLLVYPHFLSPGERERLLRERGLGLIIRQKVYQERAQRAEVIERSFYQRGEPYLERIVKTDKGEVSSLWRRETSYESLYMVEPYVKERRDYLILAQLMREMEIIPDYETFTKIDELLGEDGMVLAQSERTPFQEAITQWVGVLRLSFDLYDRLEELEVFLEALRERERKIIEILAYGPGRIVRIPDNITHEIIGKERFIERCLPSYREYKRGLEGTGKLLMAHMDGNLRGLRKEIQESPVDIVEGFTPSMTDLTLGEALEAWPEKVLWINYPSPYHLLASEAIEEKTEMLVEELGERTMLIGITEDMPAYVWPKSLSAILRVLHRRGR